jgi:AcrR family transcriptional regulator
MHTATRLLRATASDIPGLRPVLSPRELDRKNLILKAARTLFAVHGRHTMSLASFALAIWVSPNLIRRLFIDLDGLLAELIQNHLQDISRALGAVPADAPDRDAARRQAYYGATRTPRGGLNEAHLLLTRDRHHLPADLLDPIEQIHASIAFDLAPAQPFVAMALLDNPSLSPTEIDEEFSVRKNAPALPAAPKPHLLHQAPPAHRYHAQPPHQARAGPS